VRISRQLFRVGPEVMAFARWWVRQLRDLAETLARYLLPGWVKPVLVRVESDAVMEVGQDTLLTRSGEHVDTRATLLLSPSQVLTHEIQLPLAVERELDAAVDLQLERQLPLPRSQASIYWRVVSRDRASRQLRVQVYVAQRQQLERFGERLSACGLRMTRVAVVVGPKHFEGNLLPQRPRAHPLRMTRLDRRLAMSCVALGVMACIVVASQWVLERVRLNAELARVEPLAQRARAFARDLRHGSAGSEALIAMMGRPDAVDVLRTLTSDIPSDTWLYELEIKASPNDAYQLKLVGYTPAATMFVDALEKHPTFEGVRLVSAASAGLGTTRDRLTVTARFKP
jgi:hypothetical protein